MCLPGSGLGYGPPLSALGTPLLRGVGGGESPGPSRTPLFLLVVFSWLLFLGVVIGLGGWDFVVLLGFVLVFLGVLLIFIGSVGRGFSGEYGGVVVIGPFPVIFGSNSRMAVLAGVLGVILMLLSIFLLFYGRRVLGS